MATQESIPSQGMLAKIARAGRIQYRHLRFGREWRRQLRERLGGTATAGVSCPVCGGGDCRPTAFERPEGQIEKYICCGCEHLFSGFLQTDPGLGQEMFQFDTENIGKETQVLLLEELVRRSGLERGIFLDFGVGGNMSAFQEAQARLPQHRFMACDTYPSLVPGYFQTYEEESPLHMFDGISSYAVVEHLTETFAAWIYLNRLLKPVASGGGLMVHAFPSQLHHDFDHWAIQIKSHVCLFSSKSLKLLCAKTGFQMEAGKFLRPIGQHAHGVMVFRKVRDK
jgi:hypothetical protein